MKSENYVVIQGWMCNELNLKGNNLLVYAMIYGFSQDGESQFKGSRSYIANTFNISLPTVDKALAELKTRGLIECMKEPNNCCTYFCTCKETLQGDVKKLYKGCKETLQGACKETLHNNIDNINIDNNIYYITQDGNFDYQKIADLFNKICVSLPKVKMITDTRKKHIRSANKIIEGKWVEYFHTIELSDFLCGRKNKWKASFDWILKPANIVKILEGNYDNKGNSYMNELQNWVQEGK